MIRYHPEQTVVFLMAIGKLKDLTQRLVELANYPPATRVAIVEAAGCPNQRTIVGDLTNIAARAVQHNIRPPSTIVVGEVVNVLNVEVENTDGQSVRRTGVVPPPTRKERREGRGERRKD